jgi:hypothetical protein
MDAIRQRHDDALDQIGAKISGALARAKSTTELRLNQTVPEYMGAALRPDIVLRNVAAKTVVIADLAVTFEDQAAGARHRPVTNPASRPEKGCPKMNVKKTRQKSGNQFSH